MDSKIGLIIQLSGVSLIALLTVFLRRSINVPALKSWTYAWLCLSCALFCLRLAFGFDEYSVPLFGFYFLNEYLFGFLLVAGCRSLANYPSLKIRSGLTVLPMIAVAFGLPFLGDDFNLVFNIHSLILSGFFCIAGVTLWQTKIRSFGWRVMLVALLLLSLDFLQYSAMFTFRKYFGVEFEYLKYNSVIDLVLQTLLGFGMVIVLLEQVLSDVKIANEKLKKAHKKLEELAHVDPLTTALNRHAFHGYLRRRDEDGAVSGCVGFFDIDDLKVVNDVYGHAAGDAVIRAVVRAIRGIIRGEDLLFRWGGDEFFVIMVGLDAASATARMSRMEKELTGIQLHGIKQPMTISVSHAFADFEDLTDLEATIKKADAGMYRDKQMRKGLEITKEPIQELVAA